MKISHKVEFMPFAEPGSVWYNGSGAPNDELGANGDYYLNTANGNVYKKVSNSWGTPIGNIKGATGATGATGASGPEGPQGPPGSDATVDYASAAEVAEGTVSDKVISPSALAESHVLLRKYSEEVSVDLSTVVVHNLGTRAIIVKIYNNATGVETKNEITVTILDENAIIIMSDSTGTENLLVVVIG